MPKCPVCTSEHFSRLLPSEKVDQECQLRRRFVEQRLTRPASKDELKDLTDFFHQARAEILECSACTLLLRNELEESPAPTYSEDEYDPAVIEALYPRYVEAFRRKETPYRALLPPGARVLELGSHYGGFLQTAHEWGWHAEGVDIGKDTAHFVRAKGFVVHQCELTECRFPAQSFDAVFIWNCFEQIPDPAPVIIECRRILKPDGLLTVRTPNGFFYSLCQRFTSDGASQSTLPEFLIEAMGYNNLLAFPYLYGYSRATLERLIEPFGFRCEGVVNSELLTLPLPENPAWVDHEEQQVNSELKLMAGSVLANQKGVLAGPWIEVWFRSGIGSGTASANRR